MKKPYPGLIYTFWPMINETKVLIKDPKAGIPAVATMDFPALINYSVVISGQNKDH